MAATSDVKDACISELSAAGAEGSTGRDGGVLAGAGAATGASGGVGASFGSAGLGPAAPGTAACTCLLYTSPSPRD
eukprot:304271-Alexandrium_andersonii.AAC.1